MEPLRLKQFTCANWHIGNHQSLLISIRNNDSDIVSIGIKWCRTRTRGKHWRTASGLQSQSREHHGIDTRMASSCVYQRPYVLSHRNSLTSSSQSLRPCRTDPHEHYHDGCLLREGQS